MTAVVVLLLLVLGGLPLAQRIGGATVDALALAPLLGAAFLAAAATAQVAIGGSLLLLGTIALVAGAALPLLWRSPKDAPGRRPGDLVLLLGPCAVLAWTLTVLDRFSLGWDARSIWFFHARMLVAGGDDYLELARVHGWNHPDYPPLVPAVLGYAWEVTSEIDYRTGQILIAALTACGTVLTALAIARALRSRWTGAVAATASVAVCYGVWEGLATNGYVDPLAASLVLAGAGYGILAQPSTRHEKVALACLVLAGLTKNESFTYATVMITVLVAQAVVHRRRRQASPQAPLWCYGLALGAAAAWPLTVRAHGLSSGLVGSNAVADPASRFAQALDALLPLLDLAAFAVAGLVAGCLLVGGREIRRGVAYVLSLLACGCVLLSAYAVGPYEITWWLGTSLGRTSMFLQAGGLLLAVFTAGTVVEWLLRGQAPRAVRPRRGADGRAPALSADTATPSQDTSSSSGRLAALRLD